MEENLLQTLRHIIAVAGDAKCSHVDSGHEATIREVLHLAIAYDDTVTISPDELARFFHETYERLAPDFGYETRQASRKPWEQVPENNRNLMTAVCAKVLSLGGMTHREKLLADALRGVLDRAGVLDKNPNMTRPELLAAAKDYIEGRA